MNVGEVIAAHQQAMKAVLQISDSADILQKNGFNTSLINLALAELARIFKENAIEVERKRESGL